MRFLSLLATLRYSSVKAFIFQQHNHWIGLQFGACIGSQTKTTPKLGEMMGDSKEAQQPCKEIYCVRHGKSKSNEWMEKNEWGGPGYNDYHGNLRDSPLSEVGISQAKALTEQLDTVELVIVSPLTRCLETLYHSSLVKDTTTVLVLPQITERVYSLSETGRPKSDLMQEFPSSWDWSAVPEDSWWYTGSEQSEEWRPHGDNQIYAVPGEPMHRFAERMEGFRHWLRTRPEQCILLVSHWGVIRHLSGGVEVSNCHVERIYLS